MENKKLFAQAIKSRHSVRKYTDQPIEVAKLATHRTATEEANAESGLNIQLVVNEPKAFGSKLHTYGTFFSPWGYTQIDLDIVKYHFEIGAGKESFQWL